MQGHSASDTGYRLNRNNIRIDVPVPENNSKQVSLQFYLYRLHLLRPFRPVFQKKKKKNSTEVNWPTAANLASTYVHNQLVAFF